MIYEIIALGRNDPLDKIDYICGTSTDSFLSDICFETTSGASLQRLSLFDDEIRRTNDLFEDIQEMMKDILTVVRMRYISPYKLLFAFFVLIKI